MAPVWLIPLFEEMATVSTTTDYLGKVWDYAVQSRRIDQDARSRFSDIVAEVFIAGSDLSQQTGQTAGAGLYREAKHAIVTWLAERDLVGSIRIKMGSGEPMQRQGGYYAPVSGLPAFSLSEENIRRLAGSLSASAKKSAEYATTPLMGIFASGDLRTYQSNVSEQLRYLPVREYCKSPPARSRGPALLRARAEAGNGAACRHASPFFHAQPTGPRAVDAGSKRFGV